MKQKISLPAATLDFIPHQPPMRLVHRLLTRDRGAGTATAEAICPDSGLFVRDRIMTPEYFIELLAQSAAAATGYDALVDGGATSRGFLVGVDEFRWCGQVAALETLRIEIRKAFAFGQVSILEGLVRDSRGREVAQGKVRVWEESP